MPLTDLLALSLLLGLSGVLIGVLVGLFVGRHKRQKLSHALELKGLELKTHLLSGRGPSRGLSRGDVVRLSLQPGDVHLMRRP